jgi:hypothetical protein
MALRAGKELNETLALMNRAHQGSWDIDFVSLTYRQTNRVSERVGKTDRERERERERETVWWTKYTHTHTHTEREREREREREIDTANAPATTRNELRRGCRVCRYNPNPYLNPMP